MAKLLQRVVSDAANRLTESRKNIPELQRADTVPVAMNSNSNFGLGPEYREMLLRQVKKDVKQLMEESVTRKFIHEESSTITSLCAAVENCLQYGLKKRSLGLFKDCSTLSLLHKVSKNCPEAHTIVDKINNDSSSSINSPVSPSGLFSSPQIAPTFTNLSNSLNSSRKPSYNQKYQWIRIALLEKCLAKIVEYVVDQSKEFYEVDSIMADQCDGPLLASLLVGPCALDFTKVKNIDHFYSDPTADELVQRHRIHSPNMAPSSPRLTTRSSLISETIWQKRLGILMLMESESFSLAVALLEEETCEVNDSDIVITFCSWYRNNGCGQNDRIL